MEQPTVYAADVAAPLPSAGPLPTRADLAIVGGGLTGLSAALHGARRGLRVVLCEAGELANGASGRNGGQLHPGQRRDQIYLKETLGADAAAALWALGEEAVALIHRLRTELNADCHWHPGLIEACHTEAHFDDAREYADYLDYTHDAPSQVLDKAALALAIGTNRYVGGVRDPAGGHLNPFALAAALSLHAHLSGAHLHAPARVTSVGEDNTLKVATDEGERVVRTDAVLLAGNGYMRGLDPWLDARILPLVNHIIATAPLPEPVIPGGEAVSDTRAVIRYFRQDHLGRMIFGGGESFGRRPRDVAAFVRPYLREVYPQLADSPVDAAWSGTLGITAERLPIIRELRPGRYVAAGFSGQGVGLSVFAGKLIADAIAGDRSGVETFAQLKARPFPGGPRLQGTIARIAMAWFAVRDRLG